MGDKISNYANDGTTDPLKSTDLLDVSNENGATYDVSKKILLSELMAFINANVTNIYNADGTTLANRSINAQTFWNKFVNGDVIVEPNGEINDDAFLVQNSSQQEMGRLGYDQTLLAAILKLSAVGGLGPYFQATPEGVLFPRLTAAQLSAITPQDGLMVYATTTDATFTSIGFWGYENGAWAKL